MSYLEVEVKFLLPDLDRFRSRLITVGAKLRKERVYQRNVIFDTEDDALFRRGEILRLRQDTAAFITFKGLTENLEQSEAKVRLELESEVANFGATADILHHLGFSEKRIYEKYRETFQLRDVEIVLDEMPYGEFVELEGNEGAIKMAAKSLGLDWAERITANYLELMDRLKIHHGFGFDDLTFANFKGLSLSTVDLLAEPAKTNEEK